MKITTSIDINAPLSETYQAFIDLDKINDVVDGITKLEILEGNNKIEPGTKWRETRVMFGKEATEDMWVTSSEANKSYVVEAESHGSHYTSEYQFSENNGITTVNLVFTGKPLTFATKLMTPLALLMAGPTKKAFQKDMEDLKFHLEKA